MKRLLIKSLALCLLIQQPILANPLTMQGMRAHQSMVVMRTVLNTQKQNAGIFNNNVQKRTFIPAIVFAPTVTAGIAKGVVAVSTIVAAAILSTQDKKRKKDPESLIKGCSSLASTMQTQQNFSTPPVLTSAPIPAPTPTPICAPAPTTTAPFPNPMLLDPDDNVKNVVKAVAGSGIWGSIKGALAPYIQPLVPYVQPVTTAATTAVNATWAFAVANPVTVTIIGGTVVIGGGKMAYDWWTNPIVKDAPKIAPVTAPVMLKERHRETQNTVAEQKSGGSGGAPNLDPEKDPEKKDNEKSRITNSPQDLAEAMKDLKGDYERVNEKDVWRLKENGTPVQKDVHYVGKDYRHNDIEAYDIRGNHMGSINPKTKEFYKPPVKGRKI